MVLEKLVGGGLEDSKEKLVRASPVTYITKDDPPFIILHGGKDETVWLKHGEWLNEALK